MTLDDLRKQFEEKYRRLHFPLERYDSGEYLNMLTFQAWGAYRECAKANGILDGGVDIFEEELKCLKKN